MKTQKEVTEFFKNKNISLNTYVSVIEYLNAKGINDSVYCFITSNKNPKNCSFKEFLEWFESESKEDNQDIITFEGKEFIFIERDKNDNCSRCYFKHRICNRDINPCTDSTREDNKNGYYELKTTKGKDQPKELELIPKEFYSFQKDKYKFIIQLKKLVKKAILPCFYYYMFKSHDNELKKDFYCENANWRLATPEEKQMLITAVERKENKLWNEETKMFEDKSKDILVPENIKIIKYQNNQLGLVFNDNKQVLTFSDGVYIVMPFDNLDKFISCRLEKTTFEELNEGDIFIVLEGNKQNLSAYNILLPDNMCSNIDYSAIFTVKCNSLNNKIVYKLIPIK